jgi:hypothetical protein
MVSGRFGDEVGEPARLPYLFARRERQINQGYAFGDDFQEPIGDGLSYNDCRWTTFTSG